MIETSWRFLRGPIEPLPGTVLVLSGGNVSADDVAKLLAG